MPTSKPAATSMPNPASMRGIAGFPRIVMTKGATKRPATKARRQTISPRRGVSSPPTMPLMPAMRPFSSTSIAAAMPMRMPPASDAQGVKCGQSMLISVRFGAEQPGVRVQEDEEHGEAHERALPADLAPDNAVAALRDGEERRVRGERGESRPVGVGFLPVVHEHRARCGQEEEAAEEHQRPRVAAGEDVRAGPKHDRPHER